MALLGPDTSQVADPTYGGYWRTSYAARAAPARIWLESPATIGDHDVGFSVRQGRYDDGSRKGAGSAPGRTPRSAGTAGRDPSAVRPSSGAACVAGPANAWFP